MRVVAFITQCISRNCCTNCILRTYISCMSLSTKYHYSINWNSLWSLLHLKGNLWYSFQIALSILLAFKKEYLNIRLNLAYDKYRLWLGYLVPQKSVKWTRSKCQRHGILKSPLILKYKFQLTCEINTFNLEW